MPQVAPGSFIVLASTGLRHLSESRLRWTKRLQRWLAVLNHGLHEPFGIVNNTAPEVAASKRNQDNCQSECGPDDKHRQLLIQFQGTKHFKICDFRNASSWRWMLDLTYTTAQRRIDFSSVNSPYAHKNDWADGRSSGPRALTIWAAAQPASRCSRCTVRLRKCGKC